MKFRDQKGFTLVETLVTVAIVGILAATAIPNYRAMKWRAYDAVALTDFRNAKTALYADPADDVDDLFYYYITSNGGGTGSYWFYDGASFQFGSFNVGDPLPAPMSHISFSEGSIPRIVYRYYFPQTGLDYMYAYLDHEKSKHAYIMYRLRSQTFDLELENTIDKFPNDA